MFNVEKIIMLRKTLAHVDFDGSNISQKSWSRAIVVVVVF